MKEIFKYPPNIELIKSKLPVQEGTLFAYGDTVYNPQKVKLNPPLEAHEQTHLQQQERMGVDAWWDEYLKDPEFRYQQELEAFQSQYHVICEHFPDRNTRFEFLNALAGDLASELYGKHKTITEAKDDILNV